MDGARELRTLFPAGSIGTRNDHLSWRPWYDPVGLSKHLRDVLRQIPSFGNLPSMAACFLPEVPIRTNQDLGSRISEPDNPFMRDVKNTPSVGILDNVATACWAALTEAVE
jgi:hypothetical protein